MLQLKLRPPHFPLPPLQTEQIGPVMEHNQRCGTCIKRHAVHTFPQGIFQPCWKCQKKGYITIRARGWRRWLIDRILDLPRFRKDKMTEEMFEVVIEGLLIRYPQPWKPNQETDMERTEIVDREGRIFLTVNNEFLAKKIIQYAAQRQMEIDQNKMMVEATLGAD
jgi:hypothetical protein